jgi:hypothetical protein
MLKWFTVLAFAALAGSVAAPMSRVEAAQTHSHGICQPAETVGIPPPSACEGACPTGNCPPVCNDNITYIDGSCGGVTPDCFLVTLTNLPRKMCRICACDNLPNPQCYGTGNLMRSDLTASAITCYN